MELLHVGLVFRVGLLGLLDPKAKARRMLSMFEYFLVFARFLSFSGHIWHVSDLLAYVFLVYFFKMALRGRVVKWLQ